MPEVDRKLFAASQVAVSERIEKESKDRVSSSHSVRQRLRHGGSPPPAPPLRHAPPHAAVASRKILLFPLSKAALQKDKKMQVLQVQAFRTALLLPVQAVPYSTSLFRLLEALVCHFHPPLTQRHQISLCADRFYVRSTQVVFRHHNVCSCSIFLTSSTSSPQSFPWSFTLFRCDAVRSTGSLKCNFPPSSSGRRSSPKKTNNVILV